MGGICGVADIEDKALVKKMSDIISHRGDNEVISLYENVSFAERNFQNNKNLITNEEGNIFVCGDADIFNYTELRESLEKKGHRFSSELNEEVIIHLYEEYGNDCWRLLDGEFAFGLWDTNKNRLVLVKDKFGCRPLFYTMFPEKLLFASEVKSLLTVREKKEINFESASLYLLLGHLMNHLTLCKGIYGLPPAHTLIYENEKVKTNRYWMPELSITNESEEYYTKMYVEHLKNSVKKRLSKSSIGMLSGGLDSSVMCAAMAAVSEKPIKTVTSYPLGLPGECDFAKTVAEHINSEHTEVELNLDDEAKLFYKIAWLYGETGCIGGGHLHTYRIMEKAEQIKNEKGESIFNGNGSETLFTAGPWTESFLLKCLLHKIPSPLVKTASIIKANFKTQNQTIGDGLNMLSCRDIFQHILKEYGHLEYSIKDLVWHFNKEEEKIKKLLIHPYFDIRNQKELYNQFMLIDLYNLCGVVTRFYNTVPAPFSLTGRLPFLDQDYVNFGGSVPLPLRGSPYKRRLMRMAFKSYLPPSVLDRKKPPHRGQLLNIYQTEYGELVAQMLDKISFIEYDTEGFLNKDRILKNIQNFMAHKSALGYSDMMKFKIMDRLIALETWYKTFIEREDISKPLQ